MRYRLRHTALPVCLGLSLTCNEGLQPLAAPTSCPSGLVGICGTVTFRGALPDSTDGVFIVAYPKFPRSRNDLFNFQPPLPLQSLPLAGPPLSTFYTVALPNGRYEWVLAVWKKQGTITIANADSLLREAGSYRDRADTSRFGVVVVNGTGTDSIDIIVDFASMHPVSFYFPPAPAPVPRP